MIFERRTQAEISAGKGWDISPFLRTVGTIDFDRLQDMGTVTDFEGKVFFPAPGSRASGMIEPGTYWLDLNDSDMTFTLRMYGPWPTGGEIEPITPPEKSPVEKAVDEMMAKRKAKRDAAQGQLSKALPKTQDDGVREALDRAMSKLCHFELTDHERLMPYRGGGL